MIWRYFKTRRPPVRQSNGGGPEIAVSELKKITVNNDSDGELYLTIEPYPDDYRIPPGVTVEIVGKELRCNSDGSLDITQHKGNCLVLWLEDSEVFHEGRKLKPHGEPLEYE